MFFDQSQSFQIHSQKGMDVHGPMASKFHAVTGRDLDGWHWRSYVGHVQTSKLTGPKAHVIGESYQRGCEFKSLPVQLLSTLTVNLLANTHD